MDPSVIFRWVTVMVKFPGTYSSVHDTKWAFQKGKGNYLVKLIGLWNNIITLASYVMLSTSGPRSWYNVEVVPLQKDLRKVKIKTIGLVNNFILLAN